MKIISIMVAINAQNHNCSNENIHLESFSNTLRVYTHRGFYYFYNMKNTPHGTPCIYFFKQT